MAKHDKTQHTRDQEMTDSDTEDELRLDEGATTTSPQGEEDASGSDVEQHKQDSSSMFRHSSPKPKIDEDAKAFLEFTNIVSESAIALSSGSSSIFFINTSVPATASFVKNPQAPPPPPDMELPDQGFERGSIVHNASELTSPHSSLITPVPYKTPQKTNEGKTEEVQQGKQKSKRSSKQKQDKKQQVQKDNAQNTTMSRKQTKTFKDETLKASGMTVNDDGNSKKRRGRPPGKKDNVTPTKKKKDEDETESQPGNFSSIPPTLTNQTTGMQVGRGKDIVLNESCDPAANSIICQSLFNREVLDNTFLYRKNTFEADTYFLHQLDEALLQHLSQKVVQKDKLIDSTALVLDLDITI
ncbi:hypothetical protein C9374_009238 [Naegleria lovaniensis]|uniref:Uncharacterized protein n=1 Tax=Naegleria lovaniensis TaxID=51637 RepID=A0AA88GH74_NAELO|nr:uncharacterized protein C9374_009238 [Naegleria lovaniensis]KAG2377327.1 hypothetical protein C9374_009238 [Naegleria lovaniensis]